MGSSAQGLKEWPTLTGDTAGDRELSLSIKAKSSTYGSDWGVPLPALASKAGECLSLPTLLSSSWTLLSSHRLGILSARGSSVPEFPRTIVAES